MTTEDLLGIPGGGGTVPGCPAAESSVDTWHCVGRGDREGCGTATGCVTEPIRCDGGPTPVEELQTERQKELGKMKNLPHSVH